MTEDLIPGAVAAKLGAPTTAWITQYYTNSEEGFGKCWATYELAVREIKSWLIYDLKRKHITLTRCKEALRELEEDGCVTSENGEDTLYTFEGYEVHYE